MRDDQYRKLKQLNERLIDTAIVEADPANWSGSGKMPSELTRDERGDSYWCCKKASATLSVAMKIISLTGMFERTLAGSAPQKPTGNDEADTDLDRELKETEKEARKLLKQAQQRTAARGRPN